MARTEQTSPPAGTGNLPGLGESFSINLSTGQGTFSYQVPLPEGVAKHTPRVVLEYTHGAGHGAWGLGWRLNLRTIARRLDFGPPAEGLVDRFADTGTELVPCADGTFRAARETAFARYTRQGDGWRIEEADGHVHELGQHPAARVADPGHPDRVVEWLVERSLDPSGNAIEYRYRIDEGFAYPEAIRYAAYELRFEYEERPDARSDGRAGFLRRRALRCSALRLVLDPGAGERVVRTYRFHYAVAPGSATSLLTRIELTANGAADDGSQDVVRPSVVFGYSTFDPLDFALRWMEPDGTPPPGLDDDDTGLVTLDNAPLPGVLQNREGRQYYWANRGDGRWDVPRPLPRAPLATSFQRKGLAFIDMDGSGTADLMMADPDGLQGYYRNSGRDGWESFVAFPRGSRATPPWSDASLRLIDADADGLVDAVATRKRSIVWWRNTGRSGWSSPTLVPKGDPELLDIDLEDPDVHLADMTGDGSPDIVRVQSGRVEYWPSLGRGRFGAKRTMTGSPRLRRRLDNDSILLVDVDGDGCADLVHVSSDGITVHQNRNGSSFADPVTIDAVPRPIAGTVRAVNMNGRTSAALVWNTQARREPAWVQFQFAAGSPPYLLTQVENGAGLVSEIRYRSAIEDFQRDLADGDRWTTHFPFPTLVVGSTRETDQVSGRVVEVEFRYHEGHFEPRTRQFQGFRRTDRLERGDASRADTLLVHHFLMGEERQPGHGPEHAALNGMLARIETYQLDGTPAEPLPSRIESSEHGLMVLDALPDGRTRSFVYVVSHRIEDTERSGDVRIEEKSYTYDAVGNVVREVHRGSGTKDGAAQPERERVTETEYATSNTRYLLTKMSRVVLRDADGAILSEKRFHYDGPDYIGLAAGQADRGLLAREEELVLSQAAFNAHYAGMNAANLGFVFAADADGVASVFAPVRRQRYDARGLMVGSRDPIGSETRYTFDNDHLFRTALVDPLGETTFAYDRATGQIATATYPDGAVTRFVYDAQGRVLASATPGQDIANPVTTYVYDETVVPNRRIARFRQPDGTVSEGVTYFDGYGKEFQQRVQVAPGKYVVSGSKLPNPWGDPREEFEPTFSASADFALEDIAGRPSRRFFYDCRGRIARSINFNGGVSTATYHPFGVVLRDANDNDDSPENILRGQFDTPREEAFDVFRDLVGVTERTGPGQAVATRYEIGPMGEMLSVADGQGVKFRYAYDRRGDRLRISIRESGDRLVWFDARRKPIRTLDPAGHDLQAEWDAMGRQTKLKAGGAVIEQYTYDTPARHALGRLAEVTYTGGRQSFTYDVGGRLVRRDYHFDGEPAPRSLAYEYDTLGRQSAVVHDDGTRIERRLTFNGWLESVPNVIEHVERDPRGFPTEVVHANGVRTTCAYTPGPGRIRKQRTTSPQNQVYEDVEFAFDRMDTMLSRNDTAPGGAGLRQYAYDPLYQLTSVAGTENGAPVTHTYDYAPDYNLHRFDEG
ncbi:MAG: VCBS repeat-containing protein, partial [Phycisphaerales bacterium]|nr:VCBS repeat-containing protein [Phycisphaerales bacterium]